MNAQNPKILIIDDDVMLCQMISARLKKEGLDPSQAHSLAQGRKVLEAEEFEVVFLDVRLPDGNGLDLLGPIQRLPSAPEVIIITGQAGPEGARIAIESGAWDYVEKGSSLVQILLPLRRALQFRQEKKKGAARSLVFDRSRLIGQSKSFVECLDQAALAATSELPVLVTGETGTGKELLAWAIHENSPRAANSMVVVDCTALPESLVESLLFGHEAGAFTGAGSRKEGLLKQADGGTLFLDEVGDLPLNIQKTFLRFLQEHSFRRIGGNSEIRSDFRLITATNRNLVRMAGEDRFRRDLLYRLKGQIIELPPLRKRSDDIQMLTTFHLNRLSARTRTDCKGFSAEFLETLCSHDWPGNVRELFNVIEQALVTAGNDPTLFPTHLPTHIRLKATLDSLEKRKPSRALSPEPVPRTPTLSLKEAREEEIARFEKRYLSDLLAATGGEVKETCRLAQISRARLYELLRKHDLSR